VVFLPPQYFSHFQIIFMNLTVIPIEFATPEYDETVRLRYKILRLPLGLDYTAEQLAAEYTDTHLAAYDERWILRGCLVLTKATENVLKMRQVAVDDAVQGQGVGRVMVEASELWARQNGFTRFELNARETAVPFYEKLAYTAVGERFVEVGIPHFKMVKELMN
jgi:predicted GNAT family N-acyltransferase